MANSPMRKAQEAPRQEYRSSDAASFTPQTEEERERLEAEKKIKWDKLDVPIEYSGRAITLPAEPGRMPIEKALLALKRRLDDEYQPFRVLEYIDAYPHDAAVAFVKAMSRLYGWSSPQTVYTFFGPKPPQMLSVRTGYNIDDVVQCPMGAFALPGIDEQVHTGVDDEGFYVHAEIKKKDKHIVLELVAEARRIVKAESIYKGRAIRLGVDDDGDLDTNRPPEFLDVRDTTEASILFDQIITDQINTNILVPIKHTSMVKEMEIPLKRTVLLEGPYGTGKTLSARMTANIAEQHGWTFVLLDKIEGLRTALEFAKRYSPAVVFAEDIDRIACERDDEMNNLILTIDGVVSKSSEIMTILTTNNVEKLHPVILRPGRLDAVISIRAPGPNTVQQLIRHYARDLIYEHEELNGAGAAMAGHIPAVIRECVERAKLGMIGRGGNTLTDHDLVVAAETMRNHMELLKGKQPDDTVGERLAKSLQEVVHGGNGKMPPVPELLASIKETVEEIQENQ